MADCAFQDAGQKIAEHRTFGVAAELCRALKIKMRNENFTVSIDGKILTTQPMGTLALLIAQAWADGWLAARD
jgi:hypothetical protein